MHHARAKLARPGSAATPRLAQLPVAGTAGTPRRRRH